MSRTKNHLQRHHEASPPDLSPPRRRRWLAITVTTVLVIPSAIAFGTVLFNEQFPEEAIASCTVGDPGHQSTKRSTIRAKLYTDCGRFRSSKKVTTCTSDPAQEILLIPGTTYDFVVRGPQIPLLSAPKIVSATVSPEQYNDAIGVTEVDLSVPENVQALQRAFLPETLRAFDYEQPAFDRSCDPFPHIMTTKGLQLMSPSRAEQLLTVPPGVVPLDPKLPCKGFQCTATG